MKLSVKILLYAGFFVVLGANLWWHFARRRQSLDSLWKYSKSAGNKAELVKKSKSVPTREHIKRNFENVEALHGLNIRPHGLPKFANKEYVLGALLEREMDSSQLMVTTFLLSRFALRKGRGVEQVNPVYRKQWETLLFDGDEDQYLNNGIRKSHPDVVCRISHSSNSEPYFTRAVFVPNRLSHDPNDNRLMEIVRCKMTDAASAYHMFGSSHESVFVELFVKAELMANFSIPWSTRRAGYLLDQPQVEHALSATTMDPWAGYEQTTSLAGKVQDPNSKPIIHLCIPGVYRLPQGKVLHAYYEHLAHHLLLGFDHISLTVAFPWSSPAMQHFLHYFKPFIDAGKLSVVSSSSSSENIDFSPTLTGVSWARFMARLFSVNMCLYVAKGVADYVVVLDIDEYLVMKDSSMNSMRELIEFVDVPKGTNLAFMRQQLFLKSSTSSGHNAGGIDLERLHHTWQGGQGWADGDAHPLCFMQLQSEVLVDRQLDLGGNLHVSDTFYKPNNTDGIKLYSSKGVGDFAGRRFVEGTIGPGYRAHNRYGYNRVILPTRRMFQGGMSSGGACFLDARTWPCTYRTPDNHNNNNNNFSKSGICGDVNSALQPSGIVSHADRDVEIDFRDYHSLYEVVRKGDGKIINFTHTAGIYHFKLFGSAGTGLETFRRQGLSNETYPKFADNIYTTKYFPNVLKYLESLGLLDLIRALSFRDGTGNSVINAQQLPVPLLPSINISALRPITSVGWTRFHTEEQTTLQQQHVQMHHQQYLQQLAASSTAARSNTSAGAAPVSQSAPLPAASPKSAVAAVSTGPDSAAANANMTKTAVTSATTPTIASTSTLRASREAAATTSMTAMPQNIPVVSLPNFAHDFSEYVLAALIEREAHTPTLYLTLFMFCHSLLFPSDKTDATREGPTRIFTSAGQKHQQEPVLSSEEKWARTIKSFAESEDQGIYTENGDRDGYKFRYYCNITYDYTTTTSDGASSTNIRRRWFMSRGMFVPNKLTTDSNSNKRLDIFRCRVSDNVEDMKTLYQLYGRANSTAQMHVEFIREKVVESPQVHSEWTTLMKFLLPWSTRATGYMMSNVATTLDPWKNIHSVPHESTNEGTLKAATQLDGIYLAVPGLESLLSKQVLAAYLEFTQHHLNLGVDHIFFGVAYSEPSLDMYYFKRFFEPFIVEGTVSVVTMCGEVDKSGFIPTAEYEYALEGLLLGRDNPKIFYVNMMTYFSKGMSAYVGVWDVDEFFLPRLSADQVERHGPADVTTTTRYVAPVTIMDIVRHVSYPPAHDNHIPSHLRTQRQLLHTTGAASGRLTSDPDTHLLTQNLEYLYNFSLIYTNLAHAGPDKSSSSGTDTFDYTRGFANGDAHPYCYLSLSSQATATKPQYSYKFKYIEEKHTNTHTPWIGQLFAHGPQPTTDNALAFMKSIRPTHTVMYGGLHVVGSCVLEPVWDGCDHKLEDAYTFDANNTHHAFNGQTHEIPVDNSGLLEHDPHTVCDPVTHKCLQTPSSLRQTHTQLSRLYEDFGLCSKHKGHSWRVERYQPSPDNQIKFHVDHTYDEIVTTNDAKDISPTTHAVINHITTYRYWKAADPTSLTQSSEYTDTHFAHTLTQLDAKGLYVCVSVPESLALARAANVSDDVNALAKSSRTNTVTESMNAGVTADALIEFTNNADIEQGSNTSARAKASVISRYINEYTNELPAWSLDHEYVMAGSVIELSPISHSMNAVTVFLMPIIKVGMFRTSTRSNAPPNTFACVLSGGPVAATLDASSAFMVDGEIVLEDTHVEDNSLGGSQLDILRCRLTQEQASNLKQAVLQDSVIGGWPTAVYVHIFRRSSPLYNGTSNTTNTTAVRVGSFMVDWHTRINCAFVKNPNRHRSTASPTSEAIIRPWLNSDDANLALQVRISNNHDYTQQLRGKTVTKSVSNSDIYLFGGDMQTAPSRQTLPSLLEFVEHHLQLGVSHLFVASPYMWESTHTHTYTRALDVYLRNKQLTLSVMSLNHNCSGSTTASTTLQSPSYCMLGGVWPAHDLETLLLNVWGHWVKGTGVSHVGIWSTREFLIPKVNISSLSSASSNLRNIVKGIGKSSNHSDVHVFDTTIIPRTNMIQHPYSDNNPVTQTPVQWIHHTHNAPSITTADHEHQAERTSAAQLLGVDTVCSFSPRGSGTCFHVPFSRNASNRGRTAPVRKALTISHVDASQAAVYYFHPTTVCPSKTLPLPHKSDVITFEHYLYALHPNRYAPSPLVLNGRPTEGNIGSYNDYVQYFANRTLEGLVAKGLDLVVALPFRRNHYEKPTKLWEDYFLFYNRTMGGILPPFTPEQLSVQQREHTLQRERLELLQSVEKRIEKLKTIQEENNKGNGPVNKVNNNAIPQFTIEW